MKNEDVHEVLYHGRPKSPETLARQIAYEIAGCAPTAELILTLAAWKQAILNRESPKTFGDL